MRLIHGVITYNRLDYLKEHISTWDATRDKSHNWILLIADDGSKDGTQDFLKNLTIEGVRVECFFNKCRGVHHQVNQVLKRSSEIPFDIGFMAEDDMYFIQSGWDNLYIKAIKVSGFEYLCYFGKLWVKHQYGPTFHDKTKCLYDEKRKIQSEVSAYPSMGCFWTFTKNILQKVGFFDLLNFGVSGNGHTDYAFRCCRAGFNKEKTLFDAFRSEKYIAMQDENYHQSQITSGEVDINMIGVPDKFHKSRVIGDIRRIYIPYNECKYNMNGIIT